MTYSSEERRIRTCIYKSLTVQPAPRVKNHPGFHKFGWSTNFNLRNEIIKLFFLKMSAYV